MPKQISAYVEQLNKQNARNTTLHQILFALSLVAVLLVSWGLKLTGISMAGEAFCGMAEHVHSETCPAEGCSLEEHIHDATCYSNDTLDIETEEDWEASLSGVTRGETTAQTVIAVAKSQLGYTESVLNFQVDADGVRRGITRYGQWYGNPYGDWSAMFASFCLHYSGVTDLPVNAGAESMRLEWEAVGLYRAEETYTPQVGHLLFHTADGTSANAVAIITDTDNNTVTVIQGDVDDCVAEVTYPLDDGILGYGVVPELSGLTVLAETPGETTTIAQTTNYDANKLTQNNSFLLYVTSGSSYYAIDGSGNAVPVSIQNNNISVAVADPSALLWTFSKSGNDYQIKNISTGRYLYPFYNSDYDHGVTVANGQTTTVTKSDSGAKLNGSAYARRDESSGTFVMSRNEREGSVFQFGVVQNCTAWFDGTDGGLMSLGGSPDTPYSLPQGVKVKLPSEWPSPDKYEYVLRGWYDIVNNKYYEAGAQATISKDTVFYADWIAASYDIGEFNAQVDNRTIDTNDFITTRVFDYNFLFNLLSAKANITVNSSGHSETWSMITSGDNLFNGEDTLNYIFRDWDSPGDFSWPDGANEGTANYPTGGGAMSGLYTDVIRELLFNPDVQTLGKNYLGEGNYLFQICQNPAHNHHGDYYYNSERNAASYNQTDQRFYVYDYLECTRTSSGQNDEGKYSDFLPFNSPYANTNGQSLNPYSFEGIDGQYVGTTHYMYDCRYNDSDNRTDLVGANFLFGMSIDIRFYLPNKPGTLVEGGAYGNVDIYDDQMHFRFAGDDDVWVFVDGQLLLDLGGLHARESGEINFATGEVTIDGVVQQEYSRLLKTIKSGEHTLTMYYLERGSSMSNCSIYFNLAPRYDFTIYKEDVITGNALNGSEFSVYLDLECTIPAQLWTSYQAKLQGEPSSNTFKVVNGKATMWGISAGNTYYIRETKPPDAPHYGMPHGIIRLTFVKKDVYSYREEMIPDSEGVSPGFTIHEFRVDNSTLSAYVHITNGADWIKEVTSVTVRKRWADDKNHDDHLVTVHLTITDRDGTVRRLQEERLYSANGWTATWENLPKYWEDGVTPIEYGVEESYSSGYYGHVEEKEGEFVLTHSEWKPTANTNTPFEDGKEYILYNSSGQCLSTHEYAADTGFKWVSEEEAKNSDLALWTASVKNGTVRLTNRRGQTLSFWYGNGSPTDFFAKTEQAEDNNTKQYYSYSLITTQSGSGLVLKYSNYYLSSSMLSNNKFDDTTNQNNALRLFPYTLVSITERIPIEGEGHMLTNKPLDKETSVTVLKEWKIPDYLDESIYEQAMVTVKLFANGRDTGRTVTLTLKNGWQDTFYGLPYEDENEEAIVYTVQEVWKDEHFLVSYGDMIPSGGTIPIYGTIITNSYMDGGPPLPTTGSPARLLYTLCGILLMLIPLAIGIGLRRKRERRLE